MAAIGRAPIDPNHHKGMLAADDVTGEVFAVQGDAATGAINVNAYSLTSIVPYAYDYIAYTNTSTTVDTYTYKSGGSSGTTVATLTITYTDTTKNTISSVART